MMLQSVLQVVPLKECIQAFSRQLYPTLSAKEKSDRIELAARLLVSEFEKAVVTKESEL